MVDALEYFLNKLAAISTPVWDRLNPKTVFIGSYQDEQNTVNCTTLSLAIVKETKKMYFFYKMVVESGHLRNFCRTIFSEAIN
jgi:hypothetical protein